MTLISKNFIWLETTAELAERWVARNRGAGLTAEDLASRVQHRASAVRRYLELPDPPPIRNARQWERLWNPAAHEKMLTGALEKLGWSVHFSDRPVQHPLTLGPVEATQAVILERHQAEARVRLYEENGLLIPFRLRDSAILMMAEELYALAADVMGNKPSRPIVDEVAPKVFAQDVLGLPFHPWAVEFL